MDNLKEIVNAVDALPEREYSQFRQWFIERDWAKWDRQIESDASSGKLDFLRQEALEAKHTGNLRDI